MKIKDIWEVIKLMIYAIILVWVINNFLVASYTVKGDSMLPTLKEGDILLVNVIGYHLNGLERLDTVIFDSGNEEGDFYVKRVIGLPGDTVRYENDFLYVNDKVIPEPYLVEYKYFLGNYNLMDDFDLLKLTGEYKVPKNKLFVLGDNRLRSMDSRELGFIDIKKVVGKVDYKYFPISSIGKVE